MEKRITEKTESYGLELKNDIKNWLNVNSCSCINLASGDDVTSEFLKFIYDYRHIEFTKEDFLRRKRSKNVVPDYERCCALRANLDRCSRKKKGNSQFCGTHIKGTPNGSIESADIVPKKESIEVWVEDIHGIQYYIDAENNIYSPDDILNNVKNPRVILKWKKENDVYMIDN